MGEYLSLHASDGDLSGLTATFLVLLALTGLALIALWLTYVDFRDHRLPGAVVRPAWAGAAVLLAAASLLSGEPARLLGMAGGGLVLWLLYLALRHASGGALGMGDVRLAGMLGTVLGFVSPVHVLWGTIAAFVLGGLWAVGAMLTRRAGIKDRVPFGPAMLAGAALTLVLG